MLSSNANIRFSVIGASHSHAFAQADALIMAGAQLVAVFDDDEQVLDELCLRFPSAHRASSERSVLDDPDVQLITGAAIASRRADIGIAALHAGMHYIVDKPSILTWTALEAVRDAEQSTGYRFATWFHERLNSRATTKAVEMAKSGRLGTIVRSVAMAPHQTRPNERPPWFWDTELAGGILVDLGSHHFDIILELAESADATIDAAFVANTHHPDHPSFQDIGSVQVRSGDYVGSIHVDWLSPDGLGTWGDGRLFIAGTNGYAEVRSTIDIDGRTGGDHLLWVDADGVHHRDCADDELDFARRFLTDLIEGTYHAMPADRSLEVAELALRAQEMASPDANSSRGGE